MLQSVAIKNVKITLICRKKFCDDLCSDPELVVLSMFRRDG
jgi:hypothetical protein